MKEKQDTLFYSLEIKLHVHLSSLFKHFSSYSSIRRDFISFSGPALKDEIKNLINFIDILLIRQNMTKYQDL